ncbi:MAG TPA: hypothetical protein VHS31_20275 [Tepidisphaeraceae bacterium]|nr:hypothetical protein [Tepidisphaeraceae bacterium]
MIPMLAAMCVALGCAPDPRDIVDYSNEPIGMQLLRAEPSLKQRKFNTLLDFESADDAVFVSTKPAAAQNLQHAHTGKASVVLGSEAKINLSSVMSAGAFPGDWTLVGGYLWSEHAASVELRCTVGKAESHRTIDLPAKKWTAAFVDLTQLQIPADQTNAEAWLSYKSTQPMLCDDVMVLDNSEWYVSGEDSPWVVRRQGFKLTVVRDGWFSVTLDTDEGTKDGWKLEDVSTMRATFSSTGKNKWLTLYSDGRAYWDGRFEPVSDSAKKDEMLARDQDWPGQLSVADGMGRTNRNTPGDANNDGYNETLGAYEVAAKGPRMEVTLTPKGMTLVRPIIEISGLPAGKPLVTLEGQLVESLIRLSNGNVLIEVPARIERATTLNVRIE